MDQAVDDNNRPVSGRSISLAEFSHSAECFAKVFHKSPFVQAVTNFNTGRYLYVNDCFLKVAGYSREEVIGRTPTELGLLADRLDRSWLTQVLRHRGRVRRKKVRFRTRSGEVRIGLLSAEIIQLNGENVILSTVSDITEQLAVEEKYRLQSQRVVIVEQLAASLAHELRNPLAGIKGVADSFLERRKLTDVEREWMEAVRGEVQKINERLRELLDLTQPRTVNITECSLNEIVRKVVLLSTHHANSLPNRQISVELVEATNEPLNLSLDAVRMEDAVLNLLLNAIESIDKQGRVMVRVDRRRKDQQHDEAVITVTDNGCGIPVEAQPRIFEPFFSTKTKGTGIGLSTVQRTVAEFNGRITFNTRTGHGSTFELALPLPLTNDSHER